MKNEMAKITVDLYKAGTVNHAMMNKLVKITDTIFAWHVQCMDTINNTAEDRLRSMRLAIRTPCRICWWILLYV